MDIVWLVSSCVCIQLSYIRNSGGADRDTSAFPRFLSLAHINARLYNMSKWAQSGRQNIPLCIHYCSDKIAREANARALEGFRGAARGQGVE
jgi:hypothetical protein